MTAKRKFKSPAFEAIHSAASGLLSVDAIPQETMRDFEKVLILLPYCGLRERILSLW